MKHIILLLPILLIISKQSFCQVEPLKPNELSAKRALARLRDTSFYGSTFTNFSFKSENGKELTNSILLGKVYLIHFWFSACVPCIKEIDDLNNVYTMFKNNPNFEFIGLTFDDSDIVKNSTQKYGIKFPSISVPESDLVKLLSIYGKGYPSTFLIGKDGKIIFMPNSLTSDPKFKSRLIPTLEHLLSVN